MTLRHVIDGFWRRITLSGGHRLCAHTTRRNVFKDARIGELISKNQEKPPSSSSPPAAPGNAVRDRHTSEQQLRPSTIARHIDIPNEHEFAVEDGIRDQQALEQQASPLRIARHFVIPKGNWSNLVTYEHRLFRPAKWNAIEKYSRTSLPVLSKPEGKYSHKQTPGSAEPDVSRVERRSLFPQSPVIFPSLAPTEAKTKKSRSDFLQAGVAQPTHADGVVKEPEADTVTLYGKLRRFAAAGKTDEVDVCIRKLVQTKGEKPNLKLYGALILVNVSSLEGSAAAIGAVLQDMEIEGFAANTEIYHNALKALAVHPDSIIRCQVLEEMRQRWFVLTASGWHDVVAGYVREGLLEQALEALNDMQAAEVPIQGWLHDMIIYTLCDSDEIDEALAMMKIRVWTGDHIVSTSTWYYFFDAACKHLHYDAVHFIWQRRVEQHYLNPTSGQCLQVLNAAARQGDIQIATDVFRVLSKRAMAFESQHYELLIEAYIRAGNIRTALTILCIMQAAGINPNSSATSVIATYLKESPDRPQQAFMILRELKEDRTVPTEAMNRIIEACIAQNGLVEALDMYKSLHRICPDGPNVTTFNALLAGCRDGVHKDTAMFLASEMLELKIRPNVLTYDRLILVCLGDEEYEDALRYYREMRQSGYAPRQGTFIALIRRCCDAGDERAWELLETMSSLNLEDAKIRRYVNENFPETTTIGRRHVAQIL